MWRIKKTSHKIQDILFYFLDFVKFLFLCFSFFEVSLFLFSSSFSSFSLFLTLESTSKIDSPSSFLVPQEWRGRSLSLASFSLCVLRCVCPVAVQPVLTAGRGQTAASTVRLSSQRHPLKDMWAIPHGSTTASTSKMVLPFFFLIFRSQFFCFSL
jgi:hypothetical protein